MDLRKLKTLIDLVSESNVSELEITEAEGRVRIVKSPVASSGALQPGVGIHSAQQQVVASVPVIAAPVETAAVAAPAPASAAAPTGHIVKSPMVGTFYRSASPGAAPFVEVGSQIKQGQTVCIVEAMKILNEIESDASGKVVQVLAENGQAVEYGQPLFVLE